MGYDPIEVSQAARKAAKAVRKNGGSGYTETSKTVLAPPTVVVWSVDGYVFPCSEVTSGMVLEITINGVTHRGTAVANENYNGYPAVEFDSMDFVYFSGIAMGNVYVNDATDSMPDATISVVAVAETIHPIDPKYLPGVCLPVVELSTEIPVDGTEVTLSTEEGTLLTKACESGIPVCLKIRLGIGENITTPFSTVFALGTEDANSALSCTLNGTLVMIKSKDSVWTATFG